MIDGDVGGINKNSESLTQQIIINDWTVPFQKFNVAAGSLITIKGGPVQFTSDKPLECMTLLYDRDPHATFNYFSCKTCNSNCKLQITFIISKLFILMLNGICRDL